MHLSRVCLLEHCADVQGVWEYWREERTNVHIVSAEGARLPSQLERDAWGPEGGQRARQPGRQGDQAV